MGRPAKYHTPEQRKAAAARRQKKHRDRVKVSRVQLEPGAVVLSAEEVRRANFWLRDLKRFNPPVFAEDRDALDALLLKLGGTCDVSL